MTHFSVSRRKDVIRTIFDGSICSPDMLVEELDKAGFFTAPASTKYHGSYEGGLFDHSYAVARVLNLMTEQMGLVWEDEMSPWIVGLFHDLCKCDAYIKQEDGTYAYNQEQIIPGHAEKSIIVAQQMIAMPVFDEEQLTCIRFHMGAYEGEKVWRNYDRAIKKYPNVLWTHTADMYASKVLGT